MVQIYRKDHGSKVYIGSPDFGQGPPVFRGVFNRSFLVSSSTTTPPLSILIKKVFDHDFGEDVIAEHGEFVLAGSTHVESHKGSDSKQSDFRFEATYTFKKEDVFTLAGCTFKKVFYDVASKDSRFPGKVTNSSVAFLPELGIPWDTLKPMEQMSSAGATFSLETTFSPLDPD